MGPHNTVEQQAAVVPTEMAKFYEIFWVTDEGILPTLQPTTIPGRILDMAFRFGQDPAEAALRQATGHVTKDVTKDMGQTEVRGLPVR